MSDRLWDLACEMGAHIGAHEGMLDRWVATLHTEIDERKHATTLAEAIGVHCDRALETGTVTEELARAIAALMPQLLAHPCFVEAMPKTTLYFTKTRAVAVGNGSGASQEWVPVSTDNSREGT